MQMITDSEDLSRERTAPVASGLRAWIFFFLWLAWVPLALAKDPPAERAGTGHGLSYQHDEVPAIPWSIHIVKIDRANPDFELHTALANGNGFGLSALTDLLKLVPTDLGRPVAAVNGDFYRKETPYEGDPKGLQIMRGELISAPCDWACFWIDGAGNPHLTNVVSRFRVTWPNGETAPFGLNEDRSRDGAVLYTPAMSASTHTSGGRELVLERMSSGDWLPLRAGQAYVARVREVRETGNTPLGQSGMVLSIGPQLAARLPKIGPGAVLQLSTATWPDLKGTQTAIGGGPALVHRGKALSVQTVKGRHPRTAVGWNKSHIFLVEVDGRQRGLSVGMTLPELADYMAKIGCDEALNLDGGGSATMWVYGQVMNSPSEGHERGMANALVVIQKEKK
ncbi:MAG: phosphodiester glycosidase family protein [Verrucomicrobia bacterium]|nr:phosphodiester glycosidase family protein [Verrucomicrobiota bacterium]